MVGVDNIPHLRLGALHSRLLLPRRGYYQRLENCVAACPADVRHDCCRSHGMFLSFRITCARFFTVAWMRYNPEDQVSGAISFDYGAGLCISVGVIQVRTVLHTF